MIKNLYRSSCEVPLFLSDFNENLIFSTDFRKILEYQISWKSAQWGAQLFHADGQTRRADGQTDSRRDEANGPFTQFCNSS